MTSVKAQIKGETNILLNRLEILQGQVKEHEDLTEKLKSVKEEIVDAKRVLELQDAKMIKWKKELEELEQDKLDVQEDIDLTCKELDKKSDELDIIETERLRRIDWIERLNVSKKNVQEEIKECKYDLTRTQEAIDIDVKNLKKEAQIELNEVNRKIWNSETLLEELEEKIRSKSLEANAATINTKNKIEQFSEQNSMLDALGVTYKEAQARSEKLQEKNKQLAAEWAELVRKNRQVEDLLEHNKSI